MRQLFFALLSLSLLLSSCNDGDIINVELEFDQTLSLCGDEDSDNYVIYDIKTDPSESLILLFPVSTTNNLIFNPEITPHPGSFTINESSIRFNYRTYDGDPSGLICADIPDSDVNIIDDYEASGGTVNYTSTFVDDDNDGISSELEDINANDDLEDDDTDGDGIPNYKDEDDDGDNVDTKDENPDPNSDEVLDDAQDTDGDLIPDYLDDDDDDDGVITRYEDENLNGNLFDDLLTGAIVARYLDNTATDTFVNDTFNTNSYTRMVTVEFEIENVDLEILNTDSIILGTYTKSIVLEN
jgi:hypothetical protein